MYTHSVGLLSVCLSVQKEEGRLTAVEAQLGQCLAGLERLAALEARLELMERQREQKEREKKEEEGKRGIITIDRQSWINLESRVLLLETKLELTLVGVFACVCVCVGACVRTYAPSAYEPVGSEK